MTPSLVDIGANLADAAFDGDRAAVLERARTAGVTRMVVTGSSLASSAAALELARTHPGMLWSTAGVHPHHAASCDEATIPTLRRLAAAPEVVAIGECGLDYFRDLSPRPVQRAWLSQQLALGAELRLPVFLHERDAHDDLATLVAEQRSELVRAVVHCFTGDERALTTYLDLDFHIGITGWICDERRGSHLPALMRRVPLERLMIETDAPYLLPRTIRPRPGSRRNEPRYLPFVLQAVAAALGLPEEEVAAATTRTAERFFGIAADRGW